MKTAIERALYRGRDVRSGKWVEGHYVTFQDEGKPVHIIITTDGELPSMEYPYPTVYHSNVEVDPETVGQWTGLVDRNGKRIFEGDILMHFNQKEYMDFTHSVAVFIDDIGSCGCCWDEFNVAGFVLESICKKYYAACISSEWILTGKTIHDEKASNDT